MLFEAQLGLVPPFWNDFVIINKEHVVTANPDFANIVFSAIVNKECLRQVEFIRS